MPYESTAFCFFVEYGGKECDLATAKAVKMVQSGCKDSNTMYYDFKLLAFEHDRSIVIDEAVNSK